MVHNFFSYKSALPFNIFFWKEGEFSLAKVLFLKETKLSLIIMFYE